MTNYNVYNTQSQKNAITKAIRSTKEEDQQWENKNKTKSATKLIISIKT